MSISTELIALQADITNARTAIINKGGTVTSEGGSSQLSGDISTIPTGITLLDRTVTFVSEGNDYQIDSVKSGNGVCAPTVNPIKTNYKFQGWGETMENFSVVNFPYIPLDENETLYSIFRQNLPSDYQEVQYIENTTYSYINTDILLNNVKLKYEFQTYPTNTSGATDGFLIGTNGSTYLFLNLYADSTNKYWSNFDNISGGGYLYPNTFNEDYIFSIILQNGVISGTCNGNSISSGVYSAGDARLNIFKSYHSGNNFIYKGKLYYFRLYKDDVLFSYLVPCYRKSDNKPGLYDIVRNVFYTNSGTGDFTVGPLVMS